MRNGLLVTLLVMLTLPALAQLRLSALFCDNMVLQQGKVVPVWGTAAPGEMVTVSCAGQQAVDVAGVDGNWLAVLKPLAAGGPLELTVAGEQSTLTLKNVLVGEVWVCSGQSNMEFQVKGSLNGDAEVAAANDPQLRLFTQRNALTHMPTREANGRWVACTPQTAERFSAVGYFFGQELRKTRHVPVGLINVSQGWTPAEAWMSRQALEADPAFAVILKRWDHWIATYPKAKTHYEDKLAAWEEARKAAAAHQQPEPAKPKAPYSPEFIHRPCGLYNGAVSPLTPYAVAGILWYQGETNVARAYQYRKLFPALIRDWRAVWGQEELPFLFVQLASLGTAPAQPGESAWAELREAQALALALPNTGMAVTVDIGDPQDIHPKNKQEVGRRLALIARATVYGENKLPYSGPVYRSLKIEGDKIRLHFTHADGGLAARLNEPLKGFAVAGADRKFVWAQAEIIGTTLLVWSDAVPHPVAVRYAWADYPIANLTNGAGLPAVPFRTDAWTFITKGYEKMYFEEIGLDEELMTPR